MLLYHQVLWVSGSDCPDCLNASIFQAYISIVINYNSLWPLFCTFTNDNVLKFIIKLILLCYLAMSCSSPEAMSLFGSQWKNNSEWSIDLGVTQDCDCGNRNINFSSQSPKLPNAAVNHWLPETKSKGGEGSIEE